MFVVPFVQKLGVMGLTSRQIGVSVPAAVSANGIRCTLEGVAVVKVGGTEELIRAAGPRFLGQQGEIDVFTREVLAGSLRAIVGRLSVEEIIRDRAAIAEAVARRESEQARILAEEAIAVSNRELALKQAEIKALTDAAAAGPLSQAAKDQEVIAAEGDTGD